MLLGVTDVGFAMRCKDKQTLRVRYTQDVQSVLNKAVGRDISGFFVFPTSLASRCHFCIGNDWQFAPRLSGSSVGDFVKSIREQFKRLRGAKLADSLFGGSFA